MKNSRMIVTTFVVATAGLSAFAVSPAMAQETDGDRIEETVFVVGERRAYQGNFDVLETPAADQTIDIELLKDTGALNLNDALDLSASVARQNNFGGLWNAFSIRVSMTVENPATMAAQNPAILD